MKSIIKLSIILSFFLYLISCQKGDDNDKSTVCSNTIMKVKKLQALFDTEEYMEADWNTNGSIRSIKMNVPLSEYRNATYIYTNDRIKEAVLRHNHNNEVYDTVIFHYNADGKVDSMYLKNDNYFTIALAYTNGKLKKLTRYTGSDILFYWDVVTDAFNNIIKAEEWWNESTGFKKQSTYTFTRDDRKNPFADLAPYMFYLNDEYEIFRYWGPNNYTNQTYVDHTGSGINLMTGYKFKYNSDCYPETSQMTVSGAVVFTDDDYLFTYY